MSFMAKFDVVIVGGGHNGLVAACYLAKAGLKVCVLERRNIVGGAAVTEELWPGFRISRASYFPHLRQEIIEDLQLTKYGYSYGIVEPRNFFPFKHGKNLFLFSDPEKTAKEISKFSAFDAKQYLKFHKLAKTFAETVDPLILAPPPPVSDILKLMSDSDIEWIVRDFLLTSAKQLVDETFESEEVKVALCLNSVGNTSMSPEDVGTSYLLAVSEGSPGYAYAVGGSGAVSQTLERVARALGVTIMVNSPVEKIIIKDGRIIGVKLTDSSIIECTAVISNADPKTTIFKLVGEEFFEKDLLHKVKNLKSEGGQAKINLALNGLPTFNSTSQNGIKDEHKAYVGIAESVDQIIKAYFKWRFHEIPEEPPIYSFLQSAWDNSVAPPGHHTMSVLLRYVPYTINKGTWKDRKQELMDRFITIYQQYVPNITRIIENYEVLSPLDIEQIFGIDHGHVSHIEQTLNQLLSFRPMIGFSGYRLPISGLYICGAGTHPGGGVVGASGHNVAKVILEDFQKLKENHIVKG
jgi:phytoene dehydrogenase-like protein